MPIPFQNNVSPSETIPGWAIMRLTGMTVKNYQPVLQMGKPNNQFQRFYYVNGPQPVKAGSYGVCSVDFPLYVIYDDNDGADTLKLGDSWGAVSGQWTIEKNRPGYTILGHKLGDGEATPERVIVRPYDVNVVYAMLTDALHYKDSAQATVYVGPPGSEVSSEQTLFVHDGLLANSSDYLPASTFIIAQFINSAWYCTEVQGCPALSGS